MQPRSLVTAPTSEPLDIDEFKQHVNLTTDFIDDDEIMNAMIKAARLGVENTLNRALITQTWDFYWDSFPEELEIPIGPLSSVSSITYYDTDGAQQTLSSDTYTVDTNSYVGRVYLAYGQSWPSTRAIPQAVTVRCVLGYGSEGVNVPEPIRAAIKIMTADMYKDRESYITGTMVSELPKIAEMMLAPYRITHL